MNLHAFEANWVCILDFQAQQSYIVRLCLKQKVFITLKGIKRKHNSVSSRVVELR